MSDKLEPSNPMRKCSTCNEIKSVSEFGHYNITRCRACLSEYQKKWRKENKEGYERDKRRQRARARALVRLAQRHRNELETLVQDELARDEERIAKREERDKKNAKNNKARSYEKMKKKHEEG